MDRHTAENWIEHLGLKPHPEGGYYLETYRSSEKISEIGRSISTAIYYLLRSGDRSHFHRLKSDEIWHFYDGSSAVIHFIDANGVRSQRYIGLDIKNGELPQVLIPKGTWFAAEVAAPDSFILVGCTVAPGFEFQDFELADRSTLLSQYPEHREIIERLSIRSADA
jgi:predicted cupin superfamily sugar epimerase